jgi:hypothetical protein
MDAGPRRGRGVRLRSSNTDSDLVASEGLAAVIEGDEVLAEEVGSSVDTSTIA